MAQDLVLLALPCFLLIFRFPLMMGFIGLTMICFSTIFADKRHVAPRLNLVNIVDLNRVLRSEVFVSEDRQLKAIHLILDFVPILDTFQEVGHAIRAGDPRLHRIDIFVPGFLTPEDVVPVELPPTLALPEAVALREETSFSRLLFEEENDQFKFEEEGEVRANLIKISDTKGELDRTSNVHTPCLILIQIDDSSEKEEEEMSLNSRKGLKDLLAGRTKGLSSKEAPKSQPFSSPSSPSCYRLARHTQFEEEKKGAESEGG